MGVGGCRVGGLVGSGRVRLFVGNHGSGRVGSTFLRVGSSPRKVTRGRTTMWWSHRVLTGLQCPSLWPSGIGAHLGRNGL